MSQHLTVAARGILEPGEERTSSHDRERRHKARFVTALCLMGLQSGISFIDDLIGGLKPNTVALITGSEIRLEIAERYCIRAQLPERLGGLGGGSFLIDGGNSFDVYLFTSLAHGHGMDLEVALNEISISRAFTPYELQQLICKDSYDVFRQRHPKLLAISDVFQLFNEDVEKDEAARILQRIALSIKSVSELEHVPVVMTSPNNLSRLGSFVDDCGCTVMADIVEGERWVKMRLLRHPSKEPTEVLRERTDRRYNQRLLLPPSVSKSRMTTSVV